MEKEIKYEVIIATCPLCKKQDHHWHKVFYEESAKLKEAGSAYISWCNVKKDYALLTREPNIKLVTDRI